MKFLFGVFDWGLGHATRDTPLIKELLKRGHKIDIIATRRALLILKKNYILKDSVTKDKKKKRPHIGHHAGVSKDEMLVPLIFVKT